MYIIYNNLVGTLTFQPKDLHVKALVTGMDSSDSQHTWSLRNTTAQVLMQQLQCRWHKFKNTIIVLLLCMYGILEINKKNFGFKSCAISIHFYAKHSKVKKLTNWKAAVCVSNSSSSWNLLALAQRTKQLLREDDAFILMHWTCTDCCTRWHRLHNLTAPTLNMRCGCKTSAIA